MNVSKALFIATVPATTFLGHQSADAIPIMVTDATPHYFATIATCVGIDGTNYNICTSTAHLNATNSLTGNNAEFKKSFDAWNATNAAGAKWTLADGGNLPGGQFNVSIFDAQAFTNVGGLEIQVDWTYTGTDKGDFKWVQGLFDNYTISPDKIVAPFYEMDVGAAAGCDNTNLRKQCPPLYPSQYADGFFYDNPLGPWPNAFFEAQTFLSKADFTTRKLSIYEGLNYGFKLSVPEPSTLLLILAGAIVFASVKRKNGLSVDSRFN